MSHLDERFRDQRESCYRICSGLWIRKPTLPMLLTALTIVCGAVYAFWSTTAASQQRITTIEIRQVTTDSAIVGLRGSVDDLRTSIDTRQDLVVEELRALRRDLRIGPARAGGQ